MNRKSIAWMSLVLLVVLSLGLGGCKKSAVPKTPIPDESAQTVEEAAKNSQTLTPPAQETQPPLIAATSTPAVSQPASTTAPTTAPVVTKEPTAVAPAATPTPAAAVTPATTPVATTPATTPVATTPGKHVVQAGENLFRIALRYGLTTEELARANNITNPALIQVGQTLTIPGVTPSSAPAATPAPPSSPAPAGGDIKHVVQAGENLFRIALKYNYDHYYIAKYNGISNPALIVPGQVIRIPQK